MEKTKTSSHQEIIPLKPEDLHLPEPIQHLGEHTGALKEIVDPGHSFYGKNVGSSGSRRDEIMLAPGEHTALPTVVRQPSLEDHTGVIEEKTHPEGHPGYTKPSWGLELAVLTPEELHLPERIERIASHTGAIREIEHHDHDQLYTPDAEFNPLTDKKKHRKRGKGGVQHRELVCFKPGELNFPPPIERLNSHTGAQKEIVNHQEIKEPSVSTPTRISKERNELQDFQESSKWLTPKKIEIHGGVDLQGAGSAGEWNLPAGSKKRQVGFVGVKESSGKIEKVLFAEPKQEIANDEDWVQVKKGKGFVEGPHKLKSPSVYARAMLNSPKPGWANYMQKQALIK